MAIDKKRMKFKVNARITSKVRERDLLAKAEALKDDYELILPTCDQKCRACPFVKTRMHLERVSRFKDNPDKLAKLSRKGDKLARAYAATVGLAHDKKAPYLASAKYPRGTAMFALRGKTSREKLISVQNYDSPQWRVLGVLDLVKRGRLHFYSFGDSFICTGREPRPPEEYIRSAAQAVGASRADGNRLCCPHDPASSQHMEYRWTGSDVSVLLCDQCAIKAKNVLSKLAEGMAVPDVLDSIAISVVRPLRIAVGEGECPDLLNKPVDKELLDDYSSGKIGDKELVDKHMEKVKSGLRDRTDKVFVRGDRCFGSDMEAFIEDLTDDAIEMKALEGLLSGVEHPVVIESGDTVNKLLSLYWKVHGLASLRAVVSADLAESYFDDSDEVVASPLKAIRRAAKKADQEAASSKIPRYNALSTYGTLVDGIARAYKTGGHSTVNAALDVESSADHRTRSIAYAFDLALGITTREWKFTKEEKEFGKHLKKYAAKLLDSSDPDSHHAAFVAFMREAGATEEVTRL